MIGPGIAQVLESILRLLLMADGSDADAMVIVDVVFVWAGSAAG
jgi:hypothetical protein